MFFFYIGRIIGHFLFFIIFSHTKYFSNASISFIFIGITKRIANLIFICADLKNIVELRTLEVNYWDFKKYNRIF